MYKIRELEDSDYSSLIKIHEQEFPMPNLVDPIYFDKHVIEKDGKIVAAGICKLTSEALLIIDESQHGIMKIREIVDLINYMYKTVHSKGMNECHIWCVNPNIQSILFRLGFRPCKGSSMVMKYGEVR